MANAGLQLQPGDVACATTKASKILEVRVNQLETDRWMPYNAEAHEVG